MAEKPTGRVRKSTRKPAKQPIPIDTGVASAPHSATPTREYAQIEEEIRFRAYEIYEERGRQDGFQEEDWARAEVEVLAKHRRESA